MSDQAARKPQPDTQHPHYQAMLEQWRKCSDVVDGEEAVKARGTVYLPKPSGMDDGEYTAYLTRALFYGATGRTMEGLIGAVMSKESSFEPAISEADSEFLKDVGVGGESFDQIAGQLLREEMIGLGGLLVDAPDNGEGNPYIVVYDAESIINWRTGMGLDGREQLVMVALRECLYVPEGEFGTRKVDQVRVLRKPSIQQEDGSLVAQADAPVLVELWQRKETQPGSKSSEWLMVGDPAEMRAKGGKAISEITFAFCTVEGTTTKLPKPPLLPLANVNISHYRTSADLEHGRHFTALPTAWTAGFGTTTALKIGSAIAWQADDPGAKAGFLEFSGAGLASLSEAMAEKQAQMATLGARLLEEQKADAEAAETVRLRQSGERSVLAKIASSCAEALTKALRWISLWSGGTSFENVTVELNTEYTGAQMDPETLAKLMAALQGRAISFETWFYNLQRGGMVQDGRTMADELEAIEAIQPAPLPGQVMDDEGDTDDEDDADEEKSAPDATKVPQNARAKAS